MAFWVKMEEFPFHVSKFLPTMQIFYPEHQPKQPVICFMLLNKLHDARILPNHLGNAHGHSILHS